MFTGIVTDVGTVSGMVAEGDTRITIQLGNDTIRPEIGGSIACAGVCLTVVATVPGQFTVQASAETLGCTTLGGWRVGTRVNLERSLRVGDELGGHLVFGHVDGLAEVVSVVPDGDSSRWTFEAPAHLMAMLAPKGSVALDGVSLTVNEVYDRRFGINVIPHTRACTTFADVAPGVSVNLEIDMLARYVARQLGRA